MVCVVLVAMLHAQVALGVRDAYSMLLEAWASKRRQDPLVLRHCHPERPRNTNTFNRSTSLLQSTNKRVPSTL